MGGIYDQCSSLTLTWQFETLLIVFRRIIISYSCLVPIKADLSLPVIRISEDTEVGIRLHLKNFLISVNGKGIFQYWMFWGLFLNTSTDETNTQNIVSFEIKCFKLFWRRVSSFQPLKHLYNYSKQILRHFQFFLKKKWKNEVKHFHEIHLEKYQNFKMCMLPILYGVLRVSSFLE